MADKQKNEDQDKPEAPIIREVSENVPSVAGQISGLASANAPFIFFDSVPFFSTCHGVGQITVTAGRVIGQSDNALVDHVVTGHLRAPLSALRGLRNAIDKILKDATLAGAQSSGKAH